MFIDGVSFKVRGTTFKNEKGIDIQSGIKKVLNEYKEEGYIDKEELYGRNTNADIKEYDLNVSEFEDIEFGGRIRKDIFDGKTSYKVYISKIQGIDESTFLNKDFEEKNDIDDYYFHIGYVPKEDIKDLEAVLNNTDMVKYRVSIKVIGGKYKHSVYDTYSDKEKIATATLTYGFEVTLFTDDGKQENKIAENVNKHLHNTEQIKVEENNNTLNIKENTEKDERNKQKHNELGLIFFGIMFIFSFFIMPIGIIFTIWSILGMIGCWYDGS